MRLWRLAAVFAWQLLCGACGGPDTGVADRDAGIRDAAADGPMPRDAAGLQDVATGGSGDADSDAGPPVWASFPPGMAWQIQYSGDLDLDLDVQVFNLDLFDTPEGDIQTLKDRGVLVVCYFSAGSFEDWRPDAGDFPGEALGNPLEGWPGERWLDVRHQGLRPIMAARIELAASKGCDAVDPDNVDGYANDTGFDLTYDDQLAYNRFLAETAHGLGLAVSLKNDLEQIPDLVSLFDFAVNEECFDYDECDLLLPFVQAGKAVFQIQYDTSRADELCPQARRLGLDTLFKRRNLDAWRLACPP